MGVGIDLLKGAWDMVSSSKEKSAGSGPENGILGKIQSLAGIGSKESQEGVEVKNEARAERGSLFKEVGKSFMIREMPRLTAFLDLPILGSFVRDKIGLKKTPNKYPLENEIGSALALLRFVPNDWKRFITDFFANSTIFQAIVDHYPLMDGINIPLIGPNGKITERVHEGDPDAVIDAMRIIHQDLGTGIMTFQALKGLIGGTGGALAVLGGGAAAVVAGKALLSGDSSSGGGIVDSVKNAISGGPSAIGGGRKIVDIIKAHPESQNTTMQKNLLKLLGELHVTDNATLVKGKWEGNNDEVTVSFIYGDGKYFMSFDDDAVPPRSVIRVNNDSGQEIIKLTDWGSLDADDDAKDIINAIHTNPSKPLPKPEAKPETKPTETKTDKKAA